MKYFKVFNTESEYLEYVASEDFISPNVSTLRDCTNTWITVEIHKYEDDYLTFRALDSGTFSLSANDVQYSLDNGETWATLTAGSSTPTVNSGDTVLWKASNLTATSGVGIGTFSSTGDFEVEGNLLSLVYGDDFENQVPSTSSNKYYFTNLFSGNTNVINAENLVIVGQSLPDEYCRQMFHSCSNLEKIPRVLSASTIGNSTYRAMFNRCSKITTAPSIYATSIYENSMAWMFENCTSLTTPMEELSATTTYAACYQGMFKNCTSLLYTPKLPALGISWSSYKEMFNGCTSLTAITQLSMEETSKESCMHMFSGCTSLTSVPDLHVIKFNGQLGSSLSYMFAGCTSLVTAPALPATNLKTNTTDSEYGVYKGMFSGCTSLTTAPALPATILSSNCYVDMFKGCTSLTTAPSLPAETLTDGCYQSMFYGCTSLTTAPTLSSTTLANNCYYRMFHSCSELTTAPELPATTLADWCYANMFFGCSSLTTVPDTLPATTLANNCYREMFRGCNSLTTAPIISATTLANQCCMEMFRDCLLLTTVQSELPATTMAASAYTRMFYSCNSLTTAPTLPATTLANGCYDGTFQHCTALTTVQNILPATTLVERCYIDMFRDCWALPTAPELPATTLFEKSYKEMFMNCNKLNYIKCLATDINATECTVGWVKSVASNGTFVKNSLMENWTTGNNGIPTNWTVRDDSYIFVTGVTPAYGSTTITKGNTYTLTATVLPNDAYDKSVTWSTSDSTVATVNNGVITAVVCGEAIITVTTNEGGYTAQCTATVNNPVTGVTLDNNVIYITAGNTHQLEATVSPSDACGDKSVTWSTSNSNIATVSNNGLVTAVATGSATITATTTVGSYTATCAVEVSEPVAVTGVTLSDNSITIGERDTYTLSATVLPNNATNKNVTWSSSDSNVATVDSDGVVSGVATGNTTVTVTTEDGGRTAQCSVSVSASTPNYFTIESLEDSNTIKIGKAKSPSNISLSYSTDNGETWTDLTISAGRDFATINTGDKIMFKGTNDRISTAWDTYYRFYSTGNFKVYGNAMSLLWGDDFESHSEFKTGTTHNLCGLFYGTTTLVDASDLILPALTCNSDCYNGMFRGCTNLTTAPQLLATVSASGCCSSMFESCINLEVAPEIKFTNLTNQCCQRMFCMDRNSKITTPKMTKSPILRAASGVTDCYKEMFKGNGNLTEITCLLTNNSSACTSWVENISSTGTFRKSPLKTNWNRNTNGIPSGWEVVDYTE